MPKRNKTQLRDKHEINALNLKRPFELSGTKETFGIFDSSCENCELKTNLMNNLIDMDELKEQMNYTQWLDFQPVP